MSFDCWDDDEEEDKRTPIEKAFDEANDMSDSEIAHQLTKPHKKHIDKALKKVAMSRILKKLIALDDVTTLVKG